MKFDDYQPSSQRRRDFLTLKVGDNPIIIVSDIFVEIQRHFSEGKMNICLGEGCPFCAQRIPKRVAFYFYVKEKSTNEIKILRVGKTIMDSIRILRSRIKNLNHINIIKTGEQLSTKYTIYPLEPYHIEISQEEIKSLEPLQDVLSRIFGLGKINEDIEEIQ
jgi:hypothetical protein